MPEQIHASPRRGEVSVGRNENYDTDIRRISQSYHCGFNNRRGHRQRFPPA
jgi:hypothetical protein